MKSESLQSIFSIWSDLVEKSIDMSDNGISDTVSNLAQITDALNGLSKNHTQENSTFIDESSIDNLQLALKDLESLLEVKDEMTKMITKSETSIKQITQTVSALSNLEIETRILSLNASVVAQKAEDVVGRKFKVIAGEISNFSNRLNNNNMQINNSVKDFDTTFQTFVKANINNADNEHTILGNVQTMLADLLGNLSSSINQLQNEQNEIVQTINLINERLKSTLLILQFQDRMKQILVHMGDDMKLLSQKIGEDQNYNIDEHIELLKSGYTTIEQRSIGDSSNAVEEEHIENGGMVFL
ncbi:hypothetical protein [Arcobacter sp.]|uniref:hypothetical protein n=1 Tax=Arcobacter sp. TaxID=1872629 RepID=UPI003D12C948